MSGDRGTPRGQGVPVQPRGGGWGQPPMGMVEPLNREWRNRPTAHRRVVEPLRLAKPLELIESNRCSRSRPNRVPQHRGYEGGGAARGCCPPSLTAASPLPGEGVGVGGGGGGAPAVVQPVPGRQQGEGDAGSAALGGTPGSPLLGARRQALPLALPRGTLDVSSHGHGTAWVGEDL